MEEAIDKLDTLKKGDVSELLACILEAESKVMEMLNTATYLALPSNSGSSLSARASVSSH